jgi:CO/xanthine dehydrogenase Mo-binding subunit
MPDTPDRAAREAAAEVLRREARMEWDREKAWRGQHALWPGYGYAAEADICATRATRLEQVAAWLEGQADG